MNFEGNHIKLSKKDLIRSRTIVKSAILNYIQSWFSPDTTNHDLLQNLVGGNIHYSIKEWTIQNQTKKSISILNYFEKVKQDLPAILIIDTGIETRSDWQGFQPQAILWENNIKKYVIRRVMNIGISIVVATQDQASTNSVIDLLLLMFDSLRHIAGGNSLVSDEPEGSWEVRLPISNISTSMLNDSSIDNSNVDRIWATTIELPGVFFETCFKFELDGSMPLIGNKKILATRTTINLNYTQLKIGEKYPISYSPYIPNLRFWVDSKSANILYDLGFYWIIPLSLGELEIKLVTLKELDKTKTYKVIDSLKIPVV